MGSEGQKGVAGGSSSPTPPVDIVDHDHAAASALPRTVSWVLGLMGLLLVIAPWIELRPRRAGPIPASTIRHDAGFAYTIALDRLQLPASSRISVLENDELLLAVGVHDEIRLAGRGTFNHWGQTLWFSASDNSDPRTGGRIYELVLHQNLATLLGGLLRLPEGWQPAISWLGLVLAAVCMPRPQWLSRRLDQGLIRFSSLDLRVVLRLAALMLAWNLLSTDYGAITQLLDGPAYQSHGAFVDSLIHRLASRLLDAEWKLRAVPCIASFLLLAFCWRPRRGVLVMALCPLLLIELTALRYRPGMCSHESLIVLLVGCAAWPRSWKRTFGAGSEVAPAATEFGLFAAAYIGWLYFACGVSKLTVEPAWWSNVHLDLARASMAAWVGSLPPPWLDQMSQAMETLFYNHRWLDVLSAILTMVFEIGWIGALVSSGLRRSIPAFMCATHLLIFAATGILFWELATIALATTIPWRTVLGHSRSAASTITFGRRETAWVVTAGLLILIPAQWNRDVGFFLNYHRFHWTYDSLAQPLVVHRLGVFDEGENRVVPLPMNHGGFFGHTLVSQSRMLLDKYQTRTEPTGQVRLLEQVWQLVRAVRPHQSNRWLLGPFGAPPHVVSASAPLPEGACQKIHVLRGEFDIRQRGVAIEWEDLGPLPLPTRLAMDSDRSQTR